MENDKHLIKWNKMKKEGKNKFILKDGILYWGIPVGVLWAIFYQLLIDGFSLNSLINKGFVLNLVIGIFVFSLAGIIQSSFKWKKYEQHYKK